MSSSTLDDIIERKIAEIVDGAASLHAPRRIDVGTPETTINAFADITDLVQPVRATQRFFGLVDYIAEIHFLADEIMTGTVRLGESEWAFEADQDENLLATIRIRDSDTLEIVKYVEMEAEFRDLDSLLDQVAREIVGFVEPYTLALVLVQRSGPRHIGRHHADRCRRSSEGCAAASCRRRTGIGTTTCSAMSPTSWMIRSWRSTTAWNRSAGIRDLPWRRPIGAWRWHAWTRTPKRSSATRPPCGSQPDLVVARVDLAELLAERRLYEEALAQLDLAHAVAPEFARIYELRGMIYEEVGVPELTRRAALSGRGGARPGAAPELLRGVVTLQRRRSRPDLSLTTFSMPPST